MNNWHTNDGIWKPPTNRQCEIIYLNNKGEREIAEAVWVDRINKYTPCYRWRRTGGNLSKKERWMDDDKIIAWRML